MGFFAFLGFLCAHVALSMLALAFTAASLHVTTLYLVAHFRCRYIGVPSVVGLILCAREPKDWHPTPARPADKPPPSSIKFVYV